MLFDLAKCNNPNWKQRDDYGVRVARPGYDATFCAQNQLVFNSGWPIVQIAEVIDLNKDYPIKSIWVKVNVDGTRDYVDEEPAGITYDGIIDERFVSVGRKNLYYILGGKYGFDGDGNYWSEYDYKVFSHNLGYVPMFYKSEDVSELSGYVLLTSVDLRKDVDYP